ncbi:MAG: 30S ribosomal protein S4, partial [Candidatus Altiarchaeota archaeon]|nr:30S ribosomal protein S4 [Candidatus Altiarchaeota archaeon]
DKSELIDRLIKSGMLKTSALDAVLALNVEDLFERRLQTIVYRKGLAKTPKQARQIITHGHVVVGDTIINIPRYPVKLSEEESVRLKEGFSLPADASKPAAPAPSKEQETAEPAEKSEPAEGVSVGKEA